MSLTKPLLRTINTFDAIEDRAIKFEIIGGDQIFHNELEIYDNATNLKVYTKKITTFAFEHTLVANSLTNGKDYYAKVRTYDVNNVASVFSDNVYFKCLQKPVLSIPTVSTGKVNNQTIIFEGTFTSPQDTLKYYRYNLYDKNKAQIGTTPNIYDGLLKYEFTGFLDDENYFIELIAETQSGVTVSTGLLPFTADFVAPRVKTVFNLYNDHDNASVHLDAKLIQMFFKSKHSTYTFENDTVINLNNDVIYLDISEGFSIDSDFTVTMTLTDIKNETDFLVILAKYGKIRFRYYGNRIHGFIEYNNNPMKPHYATVESFEVLPTDKVVLWVQCTGGRLSMRMEKKI